MKVFMTGGSGFVGSALARRLLARGHTVRALVRAHSDARNMDGLDVERVVGDLNDRESFRKALAGVGAVFHVAADYRLWVPDRKAMFRANVDGTCALMEESLKAGVERIVYTSSVATLGILSRGGVANEETPVTYTDMIGPYKQSKFLAEEAVSRMARQGLPVVIVNPSTPVGPRDIKPTPTGRIVRDAACGRIPAYVDTGLNIVHVDDVAEGHCLAFERGEIGQRYVLGGENLSLQAILEMIATLVDRKPPSVRLSRHVLWPVALASEIYARLSVTSTPLVTLDELRMARKHMFFSSSKAERELGYHSRPAVEALADAVTWFKAQGYLTGARAPTAR